VEMIVIVERKIVKIEMQTVMNSMVVKRRIRKVVNEERKSS
jgi:hypothetical protein